MCFSAIKCFRSSEAGRFVWVVVVYKNLVPLGPKTTATKLTNCLLLHELWSQDTSQEKRLTTTLKAFYCFESNILVQLTDPQKKLISPIA